MANSNVTLVVNTTQAEALFARLDVNKQKNILRSALRKAVSPILSEAKRNFKSEYDNLTGQSFASLGSMMYRRKIGIAIGARIKAPFLGWKARFLDTGTKERFRKVKGGGRASTGKVNASLFFNTAAYSREGQAVADLSNGVIFALNKAINSGRIW